MKKIASIFICLLLLVSQVQLASASSDNSVSLEVAVDSNTYLAGSKVNISGKVLVNGQPGKGLNPTLVLKDPKGNNLFFGQWNDNEIAGDGSFATSYTLDSDALSGEYTVTVAASSQTATAKFTVLSGEAGSNAEVTVKTNKSYYTYNEAVTITGTVTNDGKAISGVDVTVLVSKDGNQLKVDQRNTNKKGEFQSFINLTPNDKDGTYVVKVKSLGKEADVSFTVGSAPPVVTDPSTPSPSEPEEKEEIIVVDEKDLAGDIADPNKSTVEIEIKGQSNDTTKLSAELNASTINKLVESNKSLKVSTKELSMLLSPELLKGLSVKDTVKVSVASKTINEKDLPVTVVGQKFLSDLFDLTITLGKDKKVSTFSAPVQVFIKVDKNKINNPKKTSAYYLNEKAKEWEYSGGKLVNNEWIFQTSHFSKYTIVENSKTFTDVKAQNWAKEYIETLAARTIIKGKTTDTFGPNDQITRAQFAVLIARALQLPQKAYQGNFKDVPASLEWSVKEIEAANAAGIVEGSNGKFNPNDQITREQMATIIVRAIEYENKELLKGLNGKKTFADASTIASYAKEAVGIAAELEIVNGITKNSKSVFAPKENATRAEASKMLYKLLETLDKM
ncbi:S-layer homology domain-containing protein [Cytobacillus sp. FJAT-53684]|uniref:S-layer homology domain-containing protein n=1 Tax=Cytobacillus mangrovibacter TaxID=3299024 RepID=A0ABW6K1Q8_9BACI